MGEPKILVLSKILVVLLPTKLILIKANYKFFNVIRIQLKLNVQV